MNRLHNKRFTCNNWTTCSRTSIARTPMARLPWLIQTRFWTPMKFCRKLKKRIFKEIFLFNHEIVCCVYSLESPHRGDSNIYTQHTIIEYKIEKVSLNYRLLLPDLAPWLALRGSNSPYLDNNFYGPKEGWTVFRIVLVAQWVRVVENAGAVSHWLESR